MKSKKTGKRIAAALLTLVMVLSLAACGGSGKNGNGKNSGGQGSGGASSAAMPEVTIRDGVVRSTQVTISDPSFSSDGLQLLAMEDGWFYGLYFSYEEDQEEGGYSLLRFKTDGSGLERYSLPKEDANSEIVCSSFSDGCFYLGLATYQNSEALDYALEHEGTTEELAIPEELSEDATGSYKIACMAADGTMKWSAPVDPSTMGTGEYYLGGVEAVGDDLYVLSGDRVDRYSKKDGSFVGNIVTAKEEEMSGAFYLLRDGTIAMADEFSSALKINAYDPAQQKFVLKSTFPTVLQGAAMFPGKTHDLYLAGDDGVYAADLGSDKLTPIINYVNSDMDAQGVVRLLETKDGELAIQIYGGDTSLEIYLLEPVDPKDVKEKKELTLGAYYIDYMVRSEIIKFNKESEDYRISIHDYSQYDLEDDSYYESTGISQMTTDIISGNAPDILLLSEHIPVETYISKGVFEDLTDLYNADDGIDKSDFMKNVTDAFLTEGRMYVAVPGFTISGVSGKKKFIGDGKDLSISKAKKIAADNGIKESNIFGIVDRNIVFQSAVESSGDQFVDWDTHTCDFNNDQFRELLEFAKLFPEEISEDAYNDDYFTQYLSDRALLNLHFINTVNDYYYMTRELFGDINVALTGFPSEKNKGPALLPSLQLGINSSASDPEGCWSFVRRFYLPEYQMKMDACLPVSERAIDAQGQELIDNLREQQEEYEKYMRELNEGSAAPIPAPDAEGETAEDEELPNLDGVPEAEDAMEGVPAEGASEESASGSGADSSEGPSESEDLLNVPIAEEDFDGTHEEYEEYLKEFEEELAAAGGSFDVDVIGEDPAALEDGATAYSGADLPMFDEKDMKAFKEMLKTLSFAVNDDTEVWNIISEEAGAYFAGQKSAAEVSDIIQSRVQVYLKEIE